MMFALFLYSYQQAADLPVRWAESCCFVEVCQRCSKLPGEDRENEQRNFKKYLIYSATEIYCSIPVLTFH